MQSPTLILTHNNLQVQTYDRANVIVNNVIKFKKSIENDKTLTYKNGEALSLQWQRINQKTNVAQDILNPFGGIYSGTAFTANTPEYGQNLVIIITTNKVSKLVCEELLTTKIEGLNGTEDNLPKLVQTEKEVKENAPPACNDDNAIIFAFNIKQNI